MSFLDTLRAAFKGGGGPRVPLARSYVSPWSFPLWVQEPGGARLPFEYRGAVACAFIDNPVAQRAVRLVAEGIGGAPLAPANKTALALVQATSAGQPLLETLAAQLLLHGNGYVQIRRDGAGKPVELFALRPDRVTVVAGADGWPASYQYKVGDTTLNLPVEDDDGWPGVVHLKAFHPADDQRSSLSTRRMHWLMPCCMPRSRARQTPRPQPLQRANPGSSAARRRALGRTTPGNLLRTRPEPGSSPARATECACSTVRLARAFGTAAAGSDRLRRRSRLTARQSTPKHGLRSSR